MWKNKYPEIAECIPEASKMVELLRCHPNAELEARFGCIRDGRFVPGVSRQIMDEIIEMMQKSAYVFGDDEWREEKDVFFDHNGSKLRTRVQYDSNAMMVIPHTTEKVMLTNSLDFKNTINDKPFDVRFSLKNELDVETPPNVVIPTLVRIKQRRRFVTENKCWAFDFSMTWSGSTKSDAEKSQMNDEAVFEIECELLRVHEMLQKSDDYIAASLLLKMHDLMPSNSKLCPRS